jgi:hypothetical protein
VGEDATDAADATAFAQLLHLQEANFSCHRNNIAFYGVVVANARCTGFATSTELNPNQTTQSQQKNYKSWNRVAKRTISIQLFKDFPFRVVVLFFLPKHPVWLSQLP